MPKSRKTQKQTIEELFHDKYASSVKLEDLNVEENFSLAAQENRSAEKMFGDLEGKRVLDLGCGFGETAVYWATKGAKVDAIDISSESIELAKKLATKYKVSKNCNFKQMAAEDLKFKDNYFDYVFGNGVLHHVQLMEAGKEIKRVLKKGGRAAFVEPLKYNPVINVYRRIANEVRTPTENPLGFGDINKLKTVFPHVKHSEYEMLTLLIFVWFFIVSRVSPNEQRYWRKILRVTGPLKLILGSLIFLDKIALSLIPPLRYFCWNTVIELRK
ncbi:MAG: class I SAM-dependent methyltransferase [Candidatus Curtissbacteria bacterium]|nr:class I SAM-dependent methyltransferase [Candidatus Curtissbacteria bacterium]